MERYDIAIIGSGPAGLSAAINAKIRNKNIIVFGNKDLSNKIIKAPKVNNYLGLVGINGLEMKEQFKKHIESLGIEITLERVNAVYSMGDYFSLMVNEKTYEAKTVIIATGMEYNKAIVGEEKFLGRGVGYCATCDAPLYKGKNVAIIGYTKEAEEEANYVSELAGKVYYIPIYKDETKVNTSIEVIKDIPVEICGENFVTSLKLKTKSIDVDGVFPLKESVEPKELVPGIEIEENHIKIDRKMRTNIPGCFAAGDCVGKPYQYIKSAGEGQVAALNAVSYLDKIK